MMPKSLSNTGEIPVCGIFGFDTKLPFLSRSKMSINSIEVLFINIAAASCKKS